MNASGVQVINWKGERARAGPWKGDERVAYLNPLVGGRTLSVGFVHRCMEQLAGTGYCRVVTGALAPLEQVGFLGAGFEAEEHLCVLTRPLGKLAPVQPLSWCAQRPYHLQRETSIDRPSVLAVDRAAFDPFWRTDPEGIIEALGATRHARLRVATLLTGRRSRGVVGYAITGRAARQGFLQRLAVHPDHQRCGVARALVIDSLGWLERRWAVQAMVNTQLDNAASLALYESLGFSRQPLGLSVLSTGLGQ